jgi:hypothetical protein
MSLKIGDLRDLVRTKIHVDEYESKMGKDEDIIVVSFKVKYRDPAQDLVNYLEKGYDWVLDADISSGTVSDGGWIVFIEAARRPSISKHLIGLLDDLKSLTENQPDEYVFRYKNDTAYQTLDKSNFENTVPLTPREYRRRNKPQELQAMLSAAGVDSRDSGEYSPDVKEFVNLSRYR